MPTLDFKRLKGLFIAALKGIAFVFAVVAGLVLFVLGMTYCPILSILVLGAVSGIVMFYDD